MKIDTYSTQIRTTIMSSKTNIRWIILTILLLQSCTTMTSQTKFIELKEYIKFPKLFVYDDFGDCQREYENSYVYCVVHVRIASDNSSQLYRNISLFSQHTLHFDHTHLERGICIQDCQNHLRSSGIPQHNKPLSKWSYTHLAKVCISNQVHQRYSLKIESKVDIYHCYTHEDASQPIDLLEIALYLTILVLVALFTASTVYDARLMCAKRVPLNYYRQPPEAHRDRLLVSFSIPRNFHRLRELPSSRTRQDLQFLEALRVVQMFRIVLLHVIISHTKVPKTNTELIEGLQHKPSTITYIADFQSYVQTFLSISGMLLAVNFLEFVDKHPTFRISAFWDKLRGRLIRVVPPYAFVILLVCSASKRLMDGPIGQQFLGEAQENCRRWWWANLLFVNNYIRTDRPCLVQSWYLATDMQLFIYGLAALVLIWRWPSLRKYIFFAVTICAVVIPTATSYRFRIVPAMTTFLKNANHYNREHRYQYDMYIPFHQNIGVYSLGMFSGMIYHRYRDSRDTILKSKLFISCFAVSVLLYCFSVGSVYWMIQHQSRIPALLSALYAMAFRQSWGIVTTFIQLTVALGHPKWMLKRFLSHSVFNVGGKFCYSVYLIHFTVIEGVYSFVKAPVFSSQSVVLAFMAQVFLWTITLGTMLSVLVELPTSTALRVLLESRKPSETSSKKKQVRQTNTTV